MRVDQHGRRRRRVGAAVEHEARLDLDDLAVGGGVVAHPDRRRVAVDVAEEALVAAVLHPHRPPECAARAGSVCTCRLMSSRAPNAPPTPPSTSRTCSSGRPRQAAICLRSSCSHCVATCSSTPVAARVGHGERRLEPEERLVLHADLVRALDDDVARRRRRSPHTMRWWRSTLPSGWIGGWLPAIAASGSSSGSSTSYVDDDRRERPPARLGMVGGDGGDRLADVAHDVGGEHRLVLADQPVGQPAGHVVGGDDRLDAGDLPRRATGRSTRSGRTGAASAAWRPTGSRRRRGRRRRRTCPAPWRCRRAAWASADRAGPVTGRRSARDVGGRSIVVTTSAPTARARRRDLLHRLDDPPVARAAADVAGQLPRGSRARSAPASRSSRSWTATIRPGRAEAALHGAGVDEGLLHVGRRAGRRDALDRDDRLADGRRRQHEARAHERTVDEHAARPALALLARALRAHQPEPLAQHVRAGSRRATRRGPSRSTPLTCSTKCSTRSVRPGRVDRQPPPSCRTGDRRRPPRRRARRVARTPTAWRRYSAVDRWSSIGRAAAAASRPNGRDDRRRCRSRAPSRRAPPSYASASAHRTIVGADRPEGERAPRCSASSTARQALATAMTMALRTPTLA